MLEGMFSRVIRCLVIIGYVGIILGALVIQTNDELEAIIEGTKV